MKGQASGRETLICALQVLHDRLLRSEAQVLDLSAQLQGLPDWKQRYEQQAALSAQQETAVLAQLAELQLEMQSAAAALLNNDNVQAKVRILERRNVELQQRCDEYYSELQRLRRVCRRNKSQEDSPQHLSMSAQKPKSLHISQVSEGVGADHVRKHSACI